MIMINPLDELSDIYLGQISEADNSPEVKLLGDAAC